MHSPSLTLPSGNSITLLGFGTWKLAGKPAQEAVQHALEVGYRHIDTADAYGNHAEVGQALQESDVSREDIFLTSKVWYDRLHRDNLLADAQRFLEELQTDYLDLLLIHWPNASIPMKESLEALEELRTAGTVKSIGVSNFSEKHLDEAIATGVVIDMNQVELHPTLPQKELRTYCSAHNIAITAYSPLGRTEDLKHDIIVSIAHKHNTTPAAVILAWLRQHEIIAIPKASSEEHIRGNFASLKLTLDEEDMRAIDTLQPQDNRLVEPEWADF